MIVKTLIELLGKCDPNTVVMLQSDPEGNGFGHLGIVYPVDSNSGTGDAPDSYKDYEKSFDECVTLVPVTNVYY